MKINIRKIFRKQLRKALRKCGYGIFQSWKLERGCSNEMIECAIREFVDPKDFAMMITQ